MFYIKSKCSKGDIAELKQLLMSRKVQCIIYNTCIYLYQKLLITFQWPLPDDHLINSELIQKIVLIFDNIIEMYKKKIIYTTIFIPFVVLCVHVSIEVYIFIYFIISYKCSLFFVRNTQNSLEIIQQNQKKHFKSFQMK